MAQTRVYEGTLDEIMSQYGRELSGLRLTVIAVDGLETECPAPFYQTATDEEWTDALRNWAANHNPSAPLLSDTAVDRDSIYQGQD